MRLTTKGRFAVTAMIDITLRQSTGSVTLAGIAERQQISLSYLEQLFAKLRKHALVEAMRGRQGGYKLMHEAQDITVAQIISAVDEGIDATGCGGRQDCGSDGGMCMTHELWDSLNTHMRTFLGSITLEKLAQDQVAKGWDAQSQSFKRELVTKVAKPVKLTAPNSIFALGTFGRLGNK